MRILFFVLLWLMPVVTAVAMPIGMTTAQSLNVRSAPSGEVVASLPMGTVAGVLDMQGDWLKVMYFEGGDTSRSREGWIHGQYFRLTSASGVGGSSCEMEYRSGAEVCLNLINTNLDCHEDLSSDTYRSCDVTAEYELATDYRGQSSLGVDVSCDAEITHHTVNGRRRSSTESDWFSHSLYSHGSDWNAMNFSFSFNSFDEIYRVQLDSVTCRIENVQLW
ncbi:SH3 domain-containing protein [Halomonas sp. MCCC 1A11062]|uniref:SH3 domain-containing protein n=1 Tax=Halomonas sp. MCCC 1A11062 TaxID=2733485 RepID=UPI001F3D56BB|nr:SH3 domain-containing protein [Halomonas sp. MCCC 1A11062]MCE8037037.1 SH3 domain-containing protein [Halomonas sp. MCCC 1A11062]